MSKYKLNWSKHSDLHDWKKVAEEKQNFYYESLGKRKWEIYEPTDMRYLKFKIGYALFGPPVNLEEKDIERHYKDPNEKKKIDYIISAIKKVNTNSVIYISFIYFIAAIENKYTEFPVIRVLKKRDGSMDHCFFIDPLGYAYKSWGKFLYTNVMPSCIYCYPKDGFYTCDDVGDLELGYSYSPQSYSILSKGIEVVSAVGSVVTGVIPGGSSEGKPIVLESAIRGISESTKHCWITVASIDNCSSVYAIHSTHSVATGIFKSDKITHYIAKILNNGPIRISWYAVFNNMYEILKHTKRVNYTHIAQLFVSILFFCHTLVSIDIIRQILKETLNDVSRGIKLNLNYRQMLFLEQLKNKLGKGGNEEAVRLLVRVYSKEKLLEEILDVCYTENKDVNRNLRTENLLEVLKVVTNTDNRKDVIINYCLFLEEVCKNCQNCYEKITEAKRYIQLKDKILINEDEIDAEASEFESSLPQLQIDNLNSTEDKNYQNSPKKIKEPNSCGKLIERTLVKTNKIDDEAADLESSLLQLQIDYSNSTEDKNYQNFPKKNEEPNSCGKFNEQTLVKTNKIDDDASDLESSLLQLQIDYSISTEDKNYQNSPKKMKEAKFKYESLLNDNEIDEDASNLDFSLLKHQIDYPNSSNHENCQSSNKKVKQAKRHLKFSDELLLSNNEIDEEASDLSNSEYEKYQSLESRLIKLEESADEKNYDPDGSSDSNLQGTTQIFFEPIEGVREPISYYNRFVSKTISTCLPIKFYSHLSEENTWLFVLPEEKYDLKLVKINVTNVENDFKCIKVSYY